MSFVITNHKRVLVFVERDLLIARQHSRVGTSRIAATSSCWLRRIRFHVDLHGTSAVLARRVEVKCHEREPDPRPCHWSALS